MAIKDSGKRRTFEGGAVRDVQEGKGRCDLMPLLEVSDVMDDVVICLIAKGVEENDDKLIANAIRYFIGLNEWDTPTAMLEVAKHYEEGIKKYGERNWEKGIPCHCFIDSGVRHYLKWKRGDDDESHSRAFIWNMLGYLWTKRNKPDLDDMPHKEVLKEWIPRDLQ